MATRKSSAGKAPQKDAAKVSALAAAAVNAGLGAPAPIPDDRLCTRCGEELRYGDVGSDLGRRCIVAELAKDAGDEELEVGQAAGAPES